MEFGLNKWVNRFNNIINQVNGLIIKSLNELGNLSLKLFNSGRKTHIHELCLGVHLEATLDCWIDGEI